MTLPDIFTRRDWLVYALHLVFVGAVLNGHMTRQYCEWVKLSLNI